MKPERFSDIVIVYKIQKFFYHIFKNINYIISFLVFMAIVHFYFEKSLELCFHSTTILILFILNIIRVKIKQQQIMMKRIRFASYVESHFEIFKKENDLPHDSLNPYFDLYISELVNGGEWCEINFCYFKAPKFESDQYYKKFIYYAEKKEFKFDEIFFFYANLYLFDMLLLKYYFADENQPISEDEAKLFDALSESLNCKWEKDYKNSFCLRSTREEVADILTNRFMKSI